MLAVHILYDEQCSTAYQLFTIVIIFYDNKYWKCTCFDKICLSQVLKERLLFLCSLVRIVYSLTPVPVVGDIMCLLLLPT